MCAVDHGRSVDTTMGLTPAEGLLMGTRCGDVDPAALIHLMRTEGLSPDDLDAVINRESGLLGLSGVSNDMREIEKAAQKGHHRALLAFKTFCYQIRKYIGAYVAAMQGLDVVIFTGGIGQGSAGVRSLACQGLGYMGIHIDEHKNQNADGFKEVCDISAADAPVRVLVVPSDEERMIARETLRALKANNITNIIRSQRNVPVPIEVSAHHIHVSQEHVEALFGPRYQLTAEVGLSQPGQYACRENVMLIGPKGRVKRVRVLGPTRPETQIEISMTEQFRLGIHPPIRESGDLEHSPGITIEGSHSAVAADKGVICALRHIHMSPEDALRFGLRDKYKVRVRVESDRELVFGDVLIRVHPSYRLAMHIDTDEANAANIRTGMIGYIDSIQSRN
jgi:acetate kinase